MLGFTACDGSGWRHGRDHEPARRLAHRAAVPRVVEPEHRAGTARRVGQPNLSPSLTARRLNVGADGGECGSATAPVLDGAALALSGLVDAPPPLNAQVAA